MGFIQRVSTLSHWQATTTGCSGFLGWLKEEPYFTLWAEALPQPDLRKESALSVLPLTWPMKLVWGFL